MPILVGKLFPLYNHPSKVLTLVTWMTTCLCLDDLHSFPAADLRAQKSLETMTSYSPMSFQDLFTFNTVNVDQLTETYSINFYGQYLTHWPEYQRIARHPFTGYVMGYVLGKAEGDGEDWHGHVSAVTVAPTYRRLGLAQQFMNNLEDVSQNVHNAYFVDLFVRESNKVAQEMYAKLDYHVYRRVLKYYRQSGPLFPSEDAFDLRKALARNASRSKSALIPLTKPITPDQLEWH